MSCDADLKPQIGSILATLWRWLWPRLQLVPTGVHLLLQSTDVIWWRSQGHEVGLDLRVHLPYEPTWLGPCSCTSWRAGSVLAVQSQGLVKGYDVNSALVLSVFTLVTGARLQIWPFNMVSESHAQL